MVYAVKRPYNRNHTLSVIILHVHSGYLSGSTVYHVIHSLLAKSVVFCL